MAKNNPEANANLRYYDLCREVPKEAQKMIIGGKLKGKTDINPMWRLKKLTELFGPVGFGWKCRITDKWLEERNNECACFVRCELRVKDGNDVWSEPIEGVGGSMFVSRTKNGLETNDECFKMAYTDAISVACKALGMGADVYWDSDIDKYNGQKSGSGAIVPPTSAQIIPQKQLPQPDDPKVVNDIGNASIEEYYHTYVEPQIEAAKNLTELNNVWNRYPIMIKFGEFVAEMSAKKMELVKASQKG